MGLITLILRVAGCIVLAAGTVFGVGDVARSLASDRTRLMTIAEAADVAGIGDSNAGAEPPSPLASGVFAQDGRGADLAAALGRQPASIVLGLGGLALLAIGRSRHRTHRAGDRGAAASK